MCKVLTDQRYLISSHHQMGSSIGTTWQVLGVVLPAVSLDYKQSINRMERPADHSRSHAAARVCMYVRLITQLQVGHCWSRYLAAGIAPKLYYYTPITICMVRGPYEQAA